MTGMVTASWIASIVEGSLIRATPPSRRMSAGTRSSAITATAPASSATRASSGVTTSMITPPFSISARPRFTRNVARSLIRARIRDPRPPAGRTIRDCLLQLEGADAVLVGALVTGVDPVGERLDQREQRRVRLDERRAVRGEVEGVVGVLADLRERRVRDRKRRGLAVLGQLHRAYQDRVGAAGREADDQRTLLEPAEPGDRVLARAGNDLGADVQQREQVAQVAGEKRELVHAHDHHAGGPGECGDAGLDLLARQVSNGVLQVAVIG